MNQIIKYLIAFAIGFIVMFCIGTCSKAVIKPANIVKPETVKQNVINAEQISDKKVDSISKELSVVTKRLNIINAGKVLSDSRAAILQDSLSVLAARTPAENDYEAGNKQALISTIDNLKNENELRDSLWNATVSNYVYASDLKDSIISEKDNKYSMLRSSFDTAISQNRILLDYSGKLEKKIKKTKTINTVIKIATVIGAGLILKNNL